jgi:hypothetical protein
VGGDRRGGAGRHEACRAHDRQRDLRRAPGVVPGSYPAARDALFRLSDRLDICFPARELRKVFNRQGVPKQTGLDFDQFLSMLFTLFTLGVLGIWKDRTARYNKADFQYTFDAKLNAAEDTDALCFHPLFTRYLHERSLPTLRKNGSLATYPYGCDTADEDYRVMLGYATD